jgi:hypothetical protein
MVPNSKMACIPPKPTPAAEATLWFKHNEPSISRQLRVQMELFHTSLLAVLLLQQLPASFANLGIPGTSATVDGYDTEHGTNAICWKTPSCSSQQRNISLPNPLVANFQTDSSVGVKLMSTCPSGNQIHGTAPIEWQRPQCFYKNYSGNTKVPIVYVQQSQVYQYTRTLKFFVHEPIPTDRNRNRHSGFLE